MEKNIFHQNGNLIILMQITQNLKQQQIILLCIHSIALSKLIFFFNIHFKKKNSYRSNILNFLSFLNPNEKINS